MRATALLLALCASGCLKAWDVGGPWACSNDESCPEGLQCDDGVCCQPGAGGKPACPTLPSPTGCPQGSSPAIFYRDRDGDGFGDATDSRSFCRQPVKERWVPTAGDCDDADLATYPGAPERCNAKDDDCNGTLDDGPGLPVITWYRDQDGDLFGDDCASCTVTSCEQPRGFVDRAGDCNDANVTIHPGAPERCDGTDQNCNEQPDDGPFLDEEPKLDGGMAVCDTGQLGVCGAGRTQCVFSNTAFAPVCVADQAAHRDVCGNNTDEDCNGNKDGPPGCGGPVNLLREPGVTVGATSFALPASLPAGLPSTCLKGMTTGSQPMGWLNPVWIGTDVRLHVWWADAPSNFGWDLSTASSAYFPIHIAPINEANEGTFVTDATSGFPNPVMMLCGPGGVLQYVPKAGARLSVKTSELRISVPLRGDANWTVVGSPAAVLSEVTHVELWLSPRQPDAGTPSFSNIFLVDAGVPGFR